MIFWSIIFFLTSAAQLTWTTLDYYPETYAFNLLSDVQNAINNKNQEGLINLMAKNCSMQVFEELLLLLLQNNHEIPIIEVQNVEQDHEEIKFEAIIGKSIYHFVAKHSRYLLSHDCSDYSYLALVDQKVLHKTFEKIARKVIKKFRKASEIKSGRRIRELVVDRVKLTDFKGREKIFESPDYYFYHIIAYPNYYNFTGNFEISNIFFNFPTGILKFDVKINTNYTSEFEINVEKDFRIISEKQLKDFNDEIIIEDVFDVESTRKIEKLLSKYIFAIENRNLTVLQDILNDPYVLSDGSKVSIDQDLLDKLSNRFTDLYVESVEHEEDQPISFRTDCEAINGTEGYEFRVRNIEGKFKLVSEATYFFKNTE